jgi:hypothetical protein
VPQTHAERQSAYRERQAAELVNLRSALADAQSTIAEQAGQIGRLERELERVYGLLETASAAEVVDDEASGSPDCPHPAALVDGDRCGGCGQMVDVVA